jgi:peptidoglycan/LPS O-acetylase OafA/YrhL
LHDAGAFDFADFYVRQIKQIIPALIVVLSAYFASHETVKHSVANMRVAIRIWLRAS